MKTLQQVKDEVAKETYDCTYMQAFSFMNKSEIIDLHDKIINRRSIEVASKALQDAAENAQITFLNFGYHAEVDKQSITSTQIITE